MNSLEKIRESIDEVVAQVMLSHADQLRTQVTERVKVVLDADAEHLRQIEAQLQDKTQHAEDLQRQLDEVRQQSAGRQQQIENLDRQLHELEALSSQASEQARKSEQQLRSNAESLQQALNAEIQQLHNRTGELEALLESTNTEVRQLREQESELRSRSQSLQKELEQTRSDAEKALKQTIETKDAQIEHTKAEAQEQIQAKERELLDQVHLLEELLVQGQHAREQQLEAKDQQFKQELEQQKATYEAKIKDLNEQIAKREESQKLQGDELQQRLQAVEKDRSEVHKQLADVSAREEDLKKQLQAGLEELTKREEHWKHRENELVTQQLELERVNSDHQGLQTIWEQRERELTGQIADFERKVADYVSAEKDWQKREHELLGHRDKVLSSSAEAAQSSQRELQMAQEEQSRLQTQIDLLMEELNKVRNTLELKQEEFVAREQELSAEIGRLQSGGGPSSASVEPAASREETAGDIAPAIEQIHAAKSQTEILKALLEGAAKFAGRAGILVSHGRTASGWSGRGFKEEAAFRRINVDCTKGLAAKVIQSRVSAQGSANEFDGSLGEKLALPADEQVFLFPLVIRDRVAALLYADGGTTGSGISRASLDELVQAASAWLEEVSRSKPSAAAESAPARAAAAESPKRAVAPAPPAPAPSPANGESGDPSHQKARRFAKLLVDEIKLYNKEEVDAGRKNHDLYDRLRDSIDKSRASYDKRWGKTISGTDYFREELVRNLAENDVAVLGSNFPS